MIIDKEGNYVNMIDNPNPHILALGISGSGKTFCLCRKIEEDIVQNKRVLIFDYSASYTEEELRRNQFQELMNTSIYNTITGVQWNYLGSNMEEALLDAFVKCLKVRSYYQKKILKEAIDIIGKNKQFTVTLLMEILETLYMTKEDSESKKNILHLLNRLSPYSDCKRISIKRAQEGLEKVYPKAVILQFSDLGEIQREFWTEFFAELLWNEVRQGKKRADMILFDEFQHMSLKSGSALETMLRQGRKAHIAVYLSSQFIGNRTNDEENSLTQAGCLLLFRPTGKDLKHVASLIDTEHMAEWKKELGNLRRGEFILKGSYTLNDWKKELCTPIACRVVNNAV